MVSELLKRGAAVFLPAADTKGIDFVVRKTDGALLEVQVKTHSTEYMANWFDVDDVDGFDNEKFFIVCVNTWVDTTEFWMFPAKVFIEYGTRSSSIILLDALVPAESSIWHSEGYACQASYVKVLGS